MLVYFASLAWLVGALAVPTAYLDPHHVNISAVPVARAALTPGNLWGQAFGPNPSDIYQGGATKDLVNPGLIAELSALVAINPDWIRKMVTYTGDPATITQITVNLYEKTSLNPIHYKVDKDFVRGWATRSDAADSWWVGAVELARLVGAVSSSTPYPENTLEMLTGRKTKSYITRTDYRIYGLQAPEGSVTELIDKERAWTIIKNAPREPLVLQSNGWECKSNALPCGNSWAVVGGHGGTKPGEPRWVTIRSRTGERSTIDLDAIFPAIAMIYGFANGAAEKP